jgi:hypothetical protein
MYNYYSAVALVRGILKSKGYSVSLLPAEAASGAYTDGSTVYVPKPIPGWDKDHWDLWLFMIFHEIGHNMPETRDIFDKWISKLPKWEFQFMNLVDDFRQERMNTGEYQGKDEIVSRGRKVWSCRQLDNPDAPTFTGTEPAIDEAFVMLYIWLDEQRIPYMPDLVHAVRYNKLSARAHAWLDILNDEFMDIHGITTAVDEYEWLKRFWDRLGIEPPEGGEDGEGEGEGEGDPSEGDGEGDGKAPSNEKYEIPFKELQFDSHEEGKPNGGLTILYDEDDFSHMRTVYREVHIDSKYNQRHDLDYPRDNLSGAVRRLIQVRSKAHYENGHRSGRLGRRVSRIVAGDDKVFKRRVPGITLDCAVSILLDGSGSMFGRKYEHAAEAAMILHQAIAPLRVPLEILGFQDRRIMGQGLDEHPKIAELQTFAKPVSTDVLYDRLNTWDYGGNNDDYTCMNYAYSRLLRQKAAKHVLITLSDGQPAHEAPGNRIGACRKAAHDMSKYIDIYGIGICDTTVRDIYPKNAVINNSSELSGVLLSFIRDYIVGGK